MNYTNTRLGVSSLRPTLSRAPLPWSRVNASRHNTTHIHNADLVILPFNAAISFTNCATASIFTFRLFTAYTLLEKHIER